MTWIPPLLLFSVGGSEINCDSANVNGEFTLLSNVLTHTHTHPSKCQLKASPSQVGRVNPPEHLLSGTVSSWPRKVLWSGIPKSELNLELTTPSDH